MGDGSMPRGTGGWRSVAVRSARPDRHGEGGGDSAWDSFPRTARVSTSLSARGRSGPDPGVVAVAVEPGGDLVGVIRGGRRRWGPREEVAVPAPGPGPVAVAPGQVHRGADGGRVGDPPAAQLPEGRRDDEHLARGCPVRCRAGRRSGPDRREATGAAAAVRLALCRRRTGGDPLVPWMWGRRGHRSIRLDPARPGSTAHCLDVLAEGRLVADSARHAQSPPSFSCRRRWGHRHRVRIPPRRTGCGGARRRTVSRRTVGRRTVGHRTVGPVRLGGGGAPPLRDVHGVPGEPGRRS